MSKNQKSKFVYKNEECMKKMHAFYDKTLVALNVPYSEDYFDTSFGKTHCLIVGDSSKPRLCTIHGGNGITTLNLKLFLPLLSEYSIIAPDVIAMPGKSDPYRHISKKELAAFETPLLIIASPIDIFFPSARVFKRAKKIFKGPITTLEINSKHLPSQEVMFEICKRAMEFLNE